MRSNVVEMVKDLEHIINLRKCKIVRMRPTERGHVMQPTHEAYPYFFFLEIFTAYLSRGEH